MSWLKTVAVDILKGVTIASQVAQGIDPLVQNTAIGKPFSTVTSELATIGNLTTVIETAANAFGQPGDGTAKLAAVLPFVSTLIQQSELVVGKHVADAQGFEDGCALVINGIVKIQNSLKAQGQQTTPAQPPPLPPATPATPAVK